MGKGMVIVVAAGAIAATLGFAVTDAGESFLAGLRADPPAAPVAPPGFKPYDGPVDPLPADQVTWDPPANAQPGPWTEYQKTEAAPAPAGTVYVDQAELDRVNAELQRQQQVRNDAQIQAKAIADELDRRR